LPFERAGKTIGACEQLKKQRKTAILCDINNMIYFIVSNRAGDVHVELMMIVSTRNRLISLLLTYIMYI